MAKKIDLNTKAVKYVLAKQKGMSKTEAKEIAGYAPTTSTYDIESTESHKIAEARFADALLSKITLNQLADELLKNVIQDTDKGAKNNAIKLAIDKIEPEDKEDNDQEQVLIVMKG